ncbi:MAG TPA: NAD+ synthase [Actinomycetes bacterium]|jgi:NAD+ synthase (glutamine-hydrolysing)|nr:NAD+ synthase [Actinomycetes bacterium]
MERLRLAGAQIDPVVGDVDGNVERILAAYREAAERNAHLVVFPELAVTGYPPEDLVFKPGFLAASRDGVERVAARTGDAAAVVGFVDPTHAGPANAAALCHRGRVLAVYHKVLLPNYGVFDEERYFVPGNQALLASFGAVRVAITICEDLWFPWGPMAAAVAAGAELVVSINGSPYRLGKAERLRPMLATRAADHGAHLLWVNQVGGQDELVFEGESTYVDPQGRIRARAASFEEDLLVVDLTLEEGATARLADRPRRTPAADPHPGLEVRHVHVTDELPDPGPSTEPRLSPSLTAEEEVYRALVVATRDYVTKNGFERVLIGLSGGIDSSLVATIATDALGRHRVTGVAMPSEYSTQGSLDDARALATSLGIELLILPIHEPVHGFLAALKEPFDGTEPGIAEENIQARVRGTLLMSLSNKFGHLVLTTGNKSELAVGYCTLYGDMAGGFSVIRDVPKTLVYALARWRNELGVVIPQSVLDKPPSAELRPGQLDTDSLPPYEALDPILERYIEDDASVEEVIAEGFDRDTVERVVRLVDGAEYKRRQAAPGPKVTGRSFGKDRRLPITNRFRGFVAPAR